MYLSNSLVRIQILQHAVYAEQAAQKHYKMIEETPVRGSIVDRNGVELAASSVTLTIGMTPAVVKGYDNGVALSKRQLAEGLAGALDLDPVETRWLFTDVARSDALVPEDQAVSTKSYVLLKKRIPQDESDRLTAYMTRYSVTGITIDREVKRYYPDGTLVPQVVGFTSQDGRGLLGLELQYDSALSGSPGFTYVETDNYYGQAGLPFTAPTSLRAKDGLTVTTTIDSRIQRIAEEELQSAVDLYQVKEGGVAIVMDPYTGSILAMVSAPVFDVNDPSAVPSGWTGPAWDPTSKTDIDYLSSSVWRNRAISDTYEPVSTFKAFTAAMAFEDNLASESTLFNDAPVVEAGWTLKCWRQNTALGNHGIERLEQGFWNSCNPVFVQVSKLIGIQRFYQYVHAFGFYNTTGVDLPGEGTGILHADPATIDMYSLSFGEQSTVTPLALLTAYNVFANGGSLMQPRVVSALSDSTGKIVQEMQPVTVRRVVSEATAARIRNMMKGVVLYGTGSAGYVEGYSVAGKTSTSNSATEKVVSFAAMAPAEQPVFTVLVVLNAPSSQTSSAAATRVAANIISRGLETLGVERVYTDSDMSKLAQKSSVPNMKGLTLRDARKLVAGLGMTLEATPAGMADDAVVKSQTPSAGTLLHHGSGVAVSSEDTVPEGHAVMPDLTGKTVSEAVEALFEAGLNADYGGNLFGVASSQGATPGTQLPRWSQVAVGFTKETPG